MKTMKKLWILLPFANLWLSWWIGWNVLPQNPADTWWGVPLLGTLVAGFFISAFIAIEKS